VWLLCGRWACNRTYYHLGAPQCITCSKFSETTLVAVCSVHLYSLSRPFPMVLLPRVHIIRVFLSFNFWFTKLRIFSQKFRIISQLVEFMLERKIPFSTRIIKKKNPPQNKTIATNLTKIFKFQILINWVFSDEKKKLPPTLTRTDQKNKTRKTLSLYLGFHIRISECFILQKMLLQQPASNYRSGK